MRSPAGLIVRHRFHRLVMGTAALVLAAAAPAGQARQDPQAILLDSWRSPSGSFVMGLQILDDTTRYAAISIRDFDDSAPDHVQTAIFDAKAWQEFGKLWLRARVSSRPEEIGKVWGGETLLSIRTETKGDIRFLLASPTPGSAAPRVTFFDLSNNLTESFDRDRIKVDAFFAGHSVVPG